MKLTKKQIRQLICLVLLIAIIAWRIWGPSDTPDTVDSESAPMQSSGETLPQQDSDTGDGADDDSRQDDAAPPQSASQDVSYSESSAPVTESGESAPSSSEYEPESDPDPPAESQPQDPAIDEDGSYTTKEDVALYIYTYGRLPDNFITKSEARDLGWEGGSLEPFAPGCCIGGDKFGNYEGLLPTAKGRRYTECDIDTMGARKRGAKRIVFSNDGLIYYTDDHYESFELLYGEE